MGSGTTRRIVRCETSSDAPGALILTLEPGGREVVDAVLALDLGIVAGGEITDALIGALRDPAAFRTALAVCNRLIAGRLRSEKEITDALRRRGFGGEIAAVLVDRLRRVHALDDARFSGAYVRDALRLRPRSKAALRAALRRRGIADALIDAALADNYPDDAEFDTALTAARGYVRRRSVADPVVQRRRLAAFLARRGYAHEVVRAVCRALVPDAGGDPDDGGWE